MGGGQRCHSTAPPHAAQSVLTVLSPGPCAQAGARDALVAALEARLAEAEYAAQDAASQLQVTLFFGCWCVLTLVGGLGAGTYHHHAFLPTPHLVPQNHSQNILLMSVLPPAPPQLYQRAHMDLQLEQSNLAVEVQRQQAAASRQLASDQARIRWAAQLPSGRLLHTSAHRVPHTHHNRQPIHCHAQTDVHLIRSQLVGLAYRELEAAQAQALQQVGELQAALNRERLRAESALSTAHASQAAAAEAREAARAAEAQLAELAAGAETASSSGSSEAGGYGGAGGGEDGEGEEGGNGEQDEGAAEGEEGYEGMTPQRHKGGDGDLFGQLPRTPGALHFEPPRLAGAKTPARLHQQYLHAAAAVPGGYKARLAYGAALQLRQKKGLESKRGTWAQRFLKRVPVPGMEAFGARGVGGHSASVALLVSPARRPYRSVAAGIPGQNSSMAFVVVGRRLVGAMSVGAGPMQGANGPAQTQAHQQAAAAAAAGVGQGASQQVGVGHTVMSLAPLRGSDELGKSMGPPRTPRASGGGVLLGHSEGVWR